MSHQLLLADTVPLAPTTCAASFELHTAKFSANPPMDVVLNVENELQFSATELRLPFLHKPKKTKG